MLKEWQVRNGLLFFCRLWRKNEHKETRIGYKIRILGQKVQPGTQNLFGN